MKFKLKFDEFFKYMAKGFFSLFGYSVETEYELFKLPKRIDVVILKAKKKIITEQYHNLVVFDFFSNHNLISFKSFKDNFSEKDVLELLVYFAGYVNAEKLATLENTTATLIITKLPSKIYKMAGFNKIAPGKYCIELSLFRLYIININDIEVKGNDALFLLGYGSSERLKTGINLVSGESAANYDQKIIDKLRETFYIRIRSFENEELGWLFLEKPA